MDFVQADRFRRKVAQEMARIFSQVDLLLVPSLRDEMLTITNFTGHPSLTLRAGFVEVREARSDWAPDPKHPLPKFAAAARAARGDPDRRLFEEGTLGTRASRWSAPSESQQNAPKDFDLCRDSRPRLSQPSKARRGFWCKLQRYGLHGKNVILCHSRAASRYSRVDSCRPAAAIIERLSVAEIGFCRACGSKLR